MFKALRSIVDDRSLKALLLVVFLILVVGMCFYSKIEHWRLLDALYFSVITLTTVGYGDITPHTDAGKIFTMIYIFFGVGIILAFVTIIAKNSNKYYKRLSEAYVKQTEDYFDKIIENTLRKINK